MQSLMPFFFQVIIALLAGFLARNTSLGFWGGFFLQLFATVLLQPQLGPASMLPGIVVVLILNRVDKRRSLQGRICPFSQDVRDECVTYFNEENIRRKDAGKNRE